MNQLNLLVFQFLINFLAKIVVSQFQYPEHGKIEFMQRSKYRRKIPITDPIHIVKILTPARAFTELDEFELSLQGRVPTEPDTPEQMNLTLKLYTNENNSTGLRFDYKEKFLEKFSLKRKTVI
uniref:Uncharacterized protein n=1 Tax=Tetranychus urticae TaxID=32264 RepID=T1K9Q7_TETUR